MIQISETQLIMGGLVAGAGLLTWLAKSYVDNFNKRLDGLYSKIGKVETDLKREIEKKVDIITCQEREKMENKTFDRIEGTLGKLDKTFDNKSTDVVGKMGTITETMQAILEKMNKRRR